MDQLPNLNFGKLGIRPGFDPVCEVEACEDERPRLIYCEPCDKFFCHTHMIAHDCDRKNVWKPIEVKSQAARNKEKITTYYKRVILPSYEKRGLIQCGSCARYVKPEIAESGKCHL